MANTWLNYGPALHPAPKTFRCPAPTSFVNVNANLACIAVTPITHIDKHMLRTAGNPLNLRNRIL